MRELLTILVVIVGGAGIIAAAPVVGMLAVVVILVAPLALVLRWLTGPPRPPRPVPPPPPRPRWIPPHTLPHGGHGGAPARPRIVHPDTSNPNAR